jgi:nitroreductase/dihydropteridine reductase
MTEAHLQAVLEQEGKDGRFRSDEAKAGQDQSRRFYVNLHRHDNKDLQHWMEKQTYLAWAPRCWAPPPTGWMPRRSKASTAR